MIGTQILSWKRSVNANLSCLTSPHLVFWPKISPDVDFSRQNHSSERPKQTSIKAGGISILADNKSLAQFASLKGRNVISVDIGELWLS